MTPRQLTWAIWMENLKWRRNLQLGGAVTIQEP